VAGVALGEEVFDQAHADVVAHAVELGVDGGVVGFGAAGGEGEVAAEGGDDGAVGQGDDFGVDFVDAGSFGEGGSLVCCVCRGRSWMAAIVFEPYFQMLRSCQSAGCAIAGEINAMRAHSSPIRAYLLDAMIL